jgi:hypothetical protein
VIEHVVTYDIFVGSGRGPHDALRRERALRGRRIPGGGVNTTIIRTMLIIVII